MDVLRYKAPSAKPVLCPGNGARLPIRVKPLPRMAINQATSEAAQHLMVRGERHPAEVVQQESMVRIVARATGIGVEELRGALTPQELRWLFGEWTKVQRHATPRYRELKDWVRKRVNDDVEIMEDGAHAYISRGPTDYYGKPIAALTDGQIEYYQAVRNAFVEFHVEGADKKVSKQWLQS